ncbi:sensor histidine kinase [Crateriforma spongiae]|uniref:histidine kinase n=2 Tax=Crateriforma conspicua TaxID=2527996 RepID=A0A5C6FVF4_9PLAN|nr:Alkaline phosphatase synthesis sensor protein PhoR [Crateriforma conspicua]
MRRAIAKSITRSRRHMPSAFLAGLVVWLVASVLLLKSYWLLLPAIGGGSLVYAALLAKFLRIRSDEVESQVDKLARENDSWKERFESLHAQSRQNAMVLAQMSDGVVVIDKDWTILLMNPMAKQLLGLRAEDHHLGRDLRAIVRLPEMVSAVEQVFAGELSKRVNIDVSQLGRVRPVSISVGAIESGGEGNLLLAIHDESEARRLESVRREFIANVSHELKTPLAAIKGYAETVELALEDDPDAAVHFMSQIREQCLRLERLVAGMMQLARAQSGQQNLRCASISLAEVVTEAVKTYRPVAAAKNIDLQAAKMDPTVRAFVDREATLTIANNLIGNAVRYTHDGGRVVVDVRGEGPVSWFVVDDTGVGIEPEELNRIFERFYRVEKTREVAGGGTGLGLSIVKNLIAALGGDIRVESRPGVGSRFAVALPAEQGYRCETQRGESSTRNARGVVV